VAIRGPGFCGEEALSGQSQYSGSVITLMTCEIIRIKRETLADLLRREIEFANYFLSHLLARIGRVEADLVDHLFNTSEIRLARALLLLANYGSDEGPEVVSVPLNQETLAELIGTTRSRVNFFLNKFRRLGLIDYNGKLEVRRALQDYVSSTRIIH
jgi:CRP/FNR family cyclic AMP-dependent transcriptional regulator